MTREEAIKVIKSIIDVEQEYGGKDNIDALNMAISALEQEPCDDAISRDFQIGDEVRIIGSDPIYDDCDVGWVIRNASEKVKTMYVMRNDGSAEEEAKAEWYKTGRHNAMLAEVIKALPSVQPSRKGHWIDEGQYAEGHNHHAYRCSKCGEHIIEPPLNLMDENPHCKYCGAKMYEPQERSDKEWK